MDRRELAKNGILSLCGFLAPKEVSMWDASKPDVTYYGYAAGSTDIPPEWESVNEDGILEHDTWKLKPMPS
ncbi:hypothetical protein LCGC14_1405800 [marine sediment metagenome]|uniref:Uncharacterized protein n=1 Tax=marine sediment metagenome TaxID=412755 RepID=A0A0F9MB59_9ZZZZ